MIPMYFLIPTLIVEKSKSSLMKTKTINFTERNLVFIFLVASKEKLKTLPVINVTVI